MILDAGESFSNIVSQRRDPGVGREKIGGMAEFVVSLQQSASHRREFDGVLHTGVYEVNLRMTLAMTAISC
jgi:hypothetical protein